MYFTPCSRLIGPEIVAALVPARGPGLAVVPAVAHGIAVPRIVVQRTAVLEIAPGKDNVYFHSRKEENMVKMFVYLVFVH